MTMNDTWGLQELRQQLEDRTETLIRNLVDIASKGGNYLLNVGPTSRRPDSRSRASSGCKADRRVDEGQRRRDLRHHGQPLQDAPVGPVHARSQASSICTSSTGPPTVN